eukprot:15006327-Alexandrium_andersonii.AAC.1
MADMGLARTPSHLPKLPLRGLFFRKHFENPADGPGRRRLQAVEEGQALLTAVLAALVSAGWTAHAVTGAFNHWLKAPYLSGCQDARSRALRHAPAAIAPGSARARPAFLPLVPPVLLPVTSLRPGLSRRLSPCCVLDRVLAEFWLRPKCERATAFRTASWPCAPKP